MLSKIAILLTFASLTVLAVKYFGDSADQALLEQEAEGQLDALREHLFRR
ncbi:MAG TPA: hypothetical protein VEC38_03370 [Candidatus Binataceae bacterium]|nr:hypothetical protein [Candidatus Binataceae bacterium]